jgi:ABC-2 type transport system ATP-binding protein
VIEIRDMSFGYTREMLFTHLDLVLEPGNIYGLLGKNGAGKTSLLKLISGLRFTRRGTIRVMGFDPSTRPVHLLEEIFMVNEEFFLPPVSPSVYESLYAGFYPRFDRGLFRECAKEFELDFTKKLSGLSFGQKKKFLLAFGIATGCRVVLLDEPTNGLDIPSKSQFRKLLSRACSEDRVVLISTHQVRDMENLIDPIIILEEGRIVFQQPMHEVTRRLSARLETREPSGNGLLFVEKTLGGWLVVKERTGGEETRVDLETLFNTVIAQRGKMERIFPTAKPAEKMEASNG